MKDLEGRQQILDITSSWLFVPKVDRNYSQGKHTLSYIFNYTKGFDLLEKKHNSIFIYTRALVMKVQEQYPTCGDIRKALNDNVIVVPVDGNEDVESDQKIIRKLFGFDNDR